MSRWALVSFRVNAVRNEFVFTWWLTRFLHGSLLSIRKVRHVTWAVHLCKFALSSSDLCHNRLGALFLVWIAAIGDVSSLLRAATTKDTMVSTFVDLAQKVISLFRV